MYGSQSTHALLPHICLLFLGFSNVYHSTCIWPTALKLGCVANTNTLFLIISLVDEIQLMLISSRHICIRSMDHSYRVILADMFINKSFQIKTHHRAQTMKPSSLASNSQFLCLLITMIKIARCSWIVCQSV